MKKNTQALVIAYIRRAKLRRCSRPVYLVYEHYVADRRRDRDNIASIAHKVIQDALVVSWILKDDGWDYVLNSFDTWHIDRKNPRIVVTIEEAEDA